MFQDRITSHIEYILISMKQNLKAIQAKALHDDYIYNNRKHNSYTVQFNEAS